MAGGALSRWRAGALLVALAAALLAVWLADPLPLRKLRLAQFDQFQRWHPRPAPAEPVPVIDIDEAALAAHGQWPWPRPRVAELLARLHEAGARVIAFDVLLAEPDRTSPAAMARLWAVPEVQAALARLPDHDAALAAAIAGRPVVLGASLSSASAPAAAASAPAVAHRVVGQGGDPLAWLPGFDSATWPLRPFSQAAAGIGALNLAADDDGVVRRVPLLLRLGGQVQPGLAVETLRVAAGESNLVAVVAPGGLDAVRIGRLTLPANARGEFWLHYGEDDPRRFISAAQVLAGQLPPRALAGRVVLVGSSAAGLMDLRASPRGDLMPGVLAHATALEQALTGHYLRRPPWATALEALLLMAGCIAVGAVALSFSVRWAALAALAGVAAAGAGAWLAFTRAGVLIDAVQPALAIVVAFIAASGTHHWLTERRQRFLREAFARYVSPNRVADLVAHPERLHLGGQRQACSFVFTDLAGFTRMMETGDPARAVALLNEYLDGMLDIVFRHEGTLDRIVGDAIAVLFSAPVPQADHRQRALDCALALDAFAQSHAKRLRAQGIAWGDTRIGVHTGTVIVGNFGGSRLFDYRALGDPVNTTARLETANKQLGTRVCVSADVLAGCSGVATRPIGRVLLQGKQQAVAVATPEAALDAAACAPADEYGQAFALLQAQDAADAPSAHPVALARFEALAARYPADPLVALHLARLRAGGAGDLVVMAGK